MSGDGGRSEYQRAILVETLARMKAIAARPDPPAWRKWEVADLAELREHGPRYEPGSWFNGGRPLPDAHRVRFLRALRELEQAGLVVTATTGRRLSNVKLTAEGRRVAEELTPSPAHPSDPA